MLSMTLEPIEGVEIGKLSLVKQLMKGIYNLNPPKPKYESMWDMQIILDYFSKIGSNDKLQFRVLSGKLATLLALATLTRVSELASISLGSVKFNKNSVCFSLSKLKKSQRAGPLKTIKLNRLKEALLCPVECLEYYIRLTAKWRSAVNSDVVFVSLAKPHRHIKPCTVGRWIKQTLADAGIDISTFSAHSTRGAAASKDVKVGAGIDQILKTADWASESTFTQFYRRELTQLNVLQDSLAQKQIKDFEITVEVRD